MTDSVDYGNTKTPSMHRRLGSATLSQLGFPGESNFNFLREKSQWDKTVLKSNSQACIVLNSDMFQLENAISSCMLSYKKANKEFDPQILCQVNKRGKIFTRRRHFDFY